MPSNIKIRIIEASGLPIMDKRAGASDAYCEVKFGSQQSQRTGVARRTLSPRWNEDFRFSEPDDMTLQDEVIEFKVWDRDIITQDDAIGVVHVGLNHLLANGAVADSIHGWFPIFDTLRGIRGQLHVKIRLQFFGDANPFKSSAANIKVFSVSLPEGYRIEEIFGFVEELIVEEDPEFSLQNRFKHFRKTNESRTQTLSNLSNRVFRSVAKKVDLVGGNCVLGYKHDFDFENEVTKRIIARGYGTACRVVKIDFEKRRSAKAQIPDASDLKIRTVTLMTLSILPSYFFVKLGGVVSVRSVKLLESRGADTENRDAWWSEVRNEIRSHALSLGCHYVMAYSETTSIFDDVCILSASGTACAMERRTDQYMKMKYDNLSQPFSDDQKHANGPYQEFEQKRRSFGRTPRRVRRRYRSCAVCHVPYNVLKAPFKMDLVRCNICKKKYVPEVIIATAQPPSNLPISGKGQLIEARTCRRISLDQGGEQNAQEVSHKIPFLEFDLHSQLVYKLRVMGLNAAFGLNLHITVGRDLIVGVATATAVYLPALPCPAKLRIVRNREVKKKEDEYYVNMQHKLIALCEKNRILAQKQLTAWRASNLRPKDDSLSMVKMGRHATQPPSSYTRISTTNDSFAESAPPLVHSHSDGQFHAQGSHDESDSSSEGDAALFLVTQDPEQHETVGYQIDDDADEDIMSALLDPLPHSGIHFFNTEVPPGNLLEVKSDSKLFTVIRRVKWKDAPDVRINQFFADIFHQLQSAIAYKARNLAPCGICCLKAVITLPQHESSRGDHIEAMLTGNIVRLTVLQEADFYAKNKLNALDRDSFSHDDLAIIDAAVPRLLPKKKSDPPIDYMGHSQWKESQSLDDLVHLTCLSFLPNTSVVKYLGRLHLHLIKELHSTRRKGELGNFSQIFLREVQTIARAHVKSRGGNVLLKYSLTEFSVTGDDKHIYGIIVMSGDAALVKHN